MKHKAFTRKWALFCAGKEFTDKDFIYRNQIIQDADFRQCDHRRASVRFCSVLDTGLAGHVIREGGDFTGNGWEYCSFSGVDYTGLMMEMEEYDHCILGNAHFRQICMIEIKACQCNYAGSCFDNTKFIGCRFTCCAFCKVCFKSTLIRKTMFRGCIFDEPVMDEVTFSDVIFDSCTFRGWKPDGSGCRLWDCSLI